MLPGPINNPICRNQVKISQKQQMSKRVAQLLKFAAQFAAQRKQLTWIDSF